MPIWWKNEFQPWRYSFLERKGRVAGKIRNRAVRILQIEHLQDRVGGLAVLTPDDGILNAHFLGSHVVFKNSLAVETDPCVGRAGNRDLDFRVFLHIPVHLFGVVGAEPELAVKLACEHERAAFCLAVTAYGCQILYRVLV